MQIQRVSGHSPDALPVFGASRSLWPAGLAVLQRRWVWVTGWLMLGMVLRVPMLGRFPLREDEALYAYWARLISSGQDTMLEWVALDKPPFFIYTLARFFTWFGPSLHSGWMLNLLVSALSLILLWLFAQHIYGTRTAHWTLALFALSPFAISFSPTLFTDPMLVMWLLLSLLMASTGFGLGAGLALGMAFATKQTALLFIPLLLCAVILGSPPAFWQQWLEKAQRHPYMAVFLRQPLGMILRLMTFAAGFYYVWFKVWQWDGWRILPSFIPSFWQQSWSSYGGLALVEPWQWPERVGQWWDVGQWLGGWTVGTLVLATLILLELVALMAKAVKNRRARADGQPAQPQRPASRHHAWSLLLTLFILVYVLFHISLSFQPWDRYLLGLTPLLAMLAARGMIVGWEALRDRRVLRAGLAVVVGSCLLWGASQATAARIPIGGDHGAYTGIEDVAKFLQSRIPDQRGVLYQRWLGWHWNWYLWDGPDGRVYWSTPEMLIDDIHTDPEGYTRFVVFPGWEFSEYAPLARALSDHDLDLVERFIVQHPEDGRLQFAVYEILTVDEAMGS